MLDQLLSEMKAVRWKLRSCDSGAQHSTYFSLLQGGACVAYLDVSVTSGKQQALLDKMLSAINFKQGELIAEGKINYSLPVLQDRSVSDLEFSKVFSLAKLQFLLDNPEQKRQAWDVLQKLRDFK